MYHAGTVFSSGQDENIFEKKDNGPATHREKGEMAFEKALRIAYITVISGIADTKR